MHGKKHFFKYMLDCLTKKEKGSDWAYPLMINCGNGKSHNNGSLNGKFVFERGMQLPRLPAGPQGEGQVHSPCVYPCPTYLPKVSLQDA